jgi:hypothetical protein
MDIRTKKYYVANDGKEFNTIEECQKYEKELMKTYYFEVFYDPDIKAKFNTSIDKMYQKKLYCKCSLESNTAFVDNISDAVRHILLRCLSSYSIVMTEDRTYIPYVRVFQVEKKDIKQDAGKLIYDITKYFPSQPKNHPPVESFESINDLFKFIWDN